LTCVNLTEDPLDMVVVEGTDIRRPRPLVEIEWAREDALTFPLCVSSLDLACRLLDPVSVGRGNVLLIDHGRTFPCEDLGEVRVGETVPVCEGRDLPGDVERVPGPYKPRLLQRPLTFRAPLPVVDVCDDHCDGHAAFPSAWVVLLQDPRKALPQVSLASKQRPLDSDDVPPEQHPGHTESVCCACGSSVLDLEPLKPTTCDRCGETVGALPWTARLDLVGSGPDDADFVVEVDSLGHARVRFGDGELGRSAAPGMAFYATYRVGNGPAGNVGAETIKLVVLKDKQSGLRLLPRNPMPAQGGTAAESIEDVKAFGPGAIRARIERAIVAEDYARIVETHAAAPGDEQRPRVQRAAATLAWTGSYYEAIVAIDPLGQLEADAGLLCDVERLLQRYRRIGHDLRVGQARYVPLEVEILVCVAPGYLRSDVKAALLAALGNRALPGGRRGFFYPDNQTFGDGIYLSALVAAAQAVQGVQSLKVVKFERKFEGSNGELASGVLPLGALEVARLDNDPSFPENGVLRLNMQGGR
jgi:hypothetical protein